jgi:hypothetical protein
MIFQNFGFNRQIVKVAAGGNTFNYPSGAFAIYDFGNPSSYGGSGTTVNDVSGNGNNGTLVNSPTWSSTNGGILQLVQASSQRIDYTGTFTPDGTYVFIWKNTDSTFQKDTGFPTFRAAYGGIYAPLGGSKGYAPIPADNSTGFSTFFGATSTPSDIQIWHQYATTVDSISSTSTTCTTYLDGNTSSASENKSFDRTGTSNSGTTYIGWDNAVSDRYANGYLMAYLHYNSVLTTTQLTDIYNNFSNRF